MNTRRVFRRALALGIVAAFAAVLTVLTAHVARAEAGVRAESRVPLCGAARGRVVRREASRKCRRKSQRGRNASAREPINSDPLSRREDLRRVLARLP